MKHLLSLLLLSSLWFGAIAQDDDLPPPTSNPKKEQPPKDDETPPSADDFKGFKTKKKVELSKFIIEPNFNFSIGQQRIDLGLSPAVGYKVFQPKSDKGRNGNTGLFVGAGVTYYYTNISTRELIPNTLVKFNLQTYGVSPFIQYNIWRGLFTRAKIELLGRRIPTDIIAQGINGNYSYQVIYIKKFTPALLIGAGYNLLQSKNIFVPLVISYNVLHNVVDKEYSIYPRGLVFQIGFINVF